MSSPLILHHEKLGAKLEAGQVPLQYADPVQEYWTVKKSAGIIDLSHQGRLTITGKDRISFLNGLLTNDIAQLKESEGIRSALLNVKARVLADLYLYNLSNSLLADTGDASASNVKSVLDRFIILEDVQVHDSSKELLLLSVQGPKAGQSLRDSLGVDIHSLKPLSLQTLGPSILIARDRTGLGGYDIILPRDEAEAVWQSLLLKGEDLGLGPVGLKALDVLRLEAGFPKYGLDVDENTIILEAGYKDAISFTKGCYMGQEVVARATHIGRVNKQLVQLRIDSREVPEPRSKLTGDGREAGFVTSAAFSPGVGKVVGLGYAHRDFAKEGVQLTVGSGAVPMMATVTKLL